MRFGVTMFATDVSMTVTDLAVEAYARRMSFVWYLSLLLF